jgi:hypothetical protein
MIDIHNFDSDTLRLDIRVRYPRPQFCLAFFLSCEHITNDLSDMPVTRKPLKDSSAYGAIVGVLGARA